MNSIRIYVDPEEKKHEIDELNYDGVGVGAMIKGDGSAALIDIILSDEHWKEDDDYYLPQAKATLSLEKAKAVYDILGRVITESENALKDED